MSKIFIIAISLCEVWHTLQTKQATIDYMN